MNRGFLFRPRPLVPVILLLGLFGAPACKKSGEQPASQPAAGKPGKPGKSPEARLQDAISRGAIVPQMGAARAAELTRIGAADALKGPRGVAVDKKGNIYVADAGNFRVVKFDSSGKQLATFGKHGTGQGEFSQPWKIAFGSDGNVLVLDRESNWIHVYTPDGRFVKSFGGPAMQFYFPGGFAVAPDGALAIADTGLDRIQLLTSDGRRQGEPLKSLVDEPLKQPTDVVFDAKGGLHAYQTTSEGSPSLLLHRPIGGGQESRWIAPESPSTVDSVRFDVGPDGRVYVTDPGKKRILVCSSDGKTCNPIQPEGTDAPPLPHLSGIALDSQGAVYVTDAESNALYKLRLRAP